MIWRPKSCLLVLCILGWLSPLLAQDNGQSPGALLLCGGGPLPSSLLQLFHTSGQGEDGRLVIIPSASQAADYGDFSSWVEPWSDFRWQELDILHARSREEAEGEPFCEKLKKATAVWISGGDQTRLAERYKGTPVEREIRNVVHRGGVVGGTSAGSAVASRVMISGGRQQPRMAAGLDLLPGTIIDQHFSQRARFARLATAVAENPDHVGIGIDESTGLFIRNNRADVVGRGAIYVYAKRSSPAVRFVQMVDENQATCELSDELRDIINSSSEYPPIRVATGQAVEFDQLVR